jgi:hypothetical protein
MEGFMEMHDGEKTVRKQPILPPRPFDQRLDILHPPCRDAQPQRAHQATRRAYNRSTLIVERKELMQGWADMLDDFRKGKTEVSLLPRKKVAASGKTKGATPTPDNAMQPVPDGDAAP